MMTQMHLYELTEQIARLTDVDSDDFAIDSMLEQLEGAFEAKVEGVAMAIRSLEAEANAYKTEAATMSAKARARTNRVESLKSYLLLNLKAEGSTRVQGRLLTVSIQRSNPKCVVQDEGAIPEEFKVVIPATVRVDRRGILAHAKETGEIPDGVDIVRGDSVRIR